MEDNDTPVTLFDVDDFVNNLAKKSHDKNLMSHYYSNNINSYDVAHNCIRETIFRIMNIPVENYTNRWLPIEMRSTIGNAVHEFIQSDEKFTETEVTLKVPSIRASARSDALINNNVLVEIKTCAYKDYASIIKSCRPRPADFCQTIFNRYLIHNYLSEIKSQTNTRTSPPKLDNYKIDYIQLIYVAHDLISSECSSISECVSVAQEVKKILKSKNNPFYFITTITLDLTVIDIAPYEEYVVNKINEINKFLNTSTIPPMSNPYINNKQCFYCIYKNVCNKYGGS